PGRSGGGGGGAAVALKTREEIQMERKKEREAVEKGVGGWVAPVGHNVDSLFYNPQKPRGKEPVAPLPNAKPKVVVSQKEALSMLEAARNKEESSTEDESSSEPDSEREEMDSSTSEESETAMDKVRDKMMRIADERNLLDSESHDSDSDSDNVPLRRAAPAFSDTDFLFQRPGRAVTNRAPSMYSGQPAFASDETANDLLGSGTESGDESDSDAEGQNVRKYFQSLAMEPPINDVDIASLSEHGPIAEPETSPTTSPKQQKSEENEIRSHIYVNLVPNVQHPKTNPTAALDAVQQIIPQIHKLSGYPGDQQSLSDLCLLVLQQISFLHSMTIPAVAEAQLTLANLHVQGFPEYETSSLRIDLHRAFVLYESSAKRGNIDAVFNVALSHEKGCGTPVSFKKAVHNYKKAALK
ncbi:hypothetical protein HDU99_005819, partial [Rhizoclosmatium hyalinum]